MQSSARRLYIASIALAATLLAVFGSSLSAAHGSGSAATRAKHSAATKVGFGPTTVIDDQRLSGEPDIKICGPNSTWSYGNCGQNNPYASVPWGFSTTSSFIWRSEDQGRTFKLVPSNVATGKPTTCPGGGDTDLGVFPGATQATDGVNFIDLQALNNFSSGVSANGGQSFMCSPVAVLASAVDRQWFGFYKTPGTTGSDVYLDYDIADGGTVAPQCVQGVNSAGNAFVAQDSSTGGLVFNPVVVVDCNDGIAGNMQVNQKTGEIYAIHTAFAKPATCSTADSVVVNRSTDHGATWARGVVYAPAALTAACANDVTTGQDFAALAIDKSGGLYAVWSQAPVDASGSLTGASHIYFSYSGDNGKTWTSEKQVDAGLNTNLDVFPWIAAGDAGRIDIVFYGTNKTDPKLGWDPGVQTTNWYPYLTQSLSATGKKPTFSKPIAVAQHASHNGGICTMGIGC
ncbi:MAG TPA: sialidase family protein, partial [Chloroflexota bacterium]|nr:sialidase family protein [Chloroflexota bacterium]